jgi:hypothetical protein
MATAIGAWLFLREGDGIRPAITTAHGHLKSPDFVLASLRARPNMRFGFSTEYGREL